MRTCQESSAYLHSLGISDTKLAEACDVDRAYFNQVRNGKRQGGEKLQARLNTLCEEALARGIPPVKVAQRKTLHSHGEKQSPFSPVTVVDALPAHSSQEIIPYTAPIEKNRYASSPIFQSGASHTRKPSEENTTPIDQWTEAIAELRTLFARQRQKPSSPHLALPSPVSPSPTNYRDVALLPSSPIVEPSTHSPKEVPASPSPPPMTHKSTWQRLKDAYTRGREIQQQDRQQARLKTSSQPMQQENISQPMQQENTLQETLSPLQEIPLAHIGHAKAPSFKLRR